MVVTGRWGWCMTKTVQGDIRIFSDNFLLSVWSWTNNIKICSMCFYSNINVAFGYIKKLFRNFVRGWNCGFILLSLSKTRDFYWLVVLVRILYLKKTSLAFIGYRWVMDILLTNYWWKKGNCKSCAEFNE